MKKQSRQLIESKGQAGNRVSRPWWNASGTAILAQNREMEEQSRQPIENKRQARNRVSRSRRALAGVAMPTQKRRMEEQSRQLIEDKRQASRRASRMNHGRPAWGGERRAPWGPTVSPDDLTRRPFPE